MIIHEDLKDFLKIGHFKNIQYGLTRNELIGLLGETDWKFLSSDDDINPSIYKYGKIEFYFEENSDNKLSGIMFQPIPSPAESGNLKCNYIEWTNETDLEKVTEFLKANGIKFHEKSHPDKEAKVLLTEGEVEILFDCQETPGQFFLHKLGKFA